ncbi:recombinase family protein [Mycolicibacterium fortuitum]|uniref:Recombinase family protein n=2 Tax=Mycolicibacterium fortuitum TaxID=1766 RepID=A0AAE5AAP7_MYCFO|nr:recombinase family protein [Mycolicibacterium fortuitum]MCV7141399.1 recombinase family protein [Mycolicibacterium fortuitum]MDV7189595.1 recombinase family protein [Mycolicibacterium fortuitum]MDV7203108.1 recombinase family protein [Mycolicibacterium fortuitum]MDV7224676.1 recombinase family protein [Mycolicibacterium fortuitum]MDV7256798.1 recombinase family protein [Mycolicibacterium fortuitum]
MYLRQSRDRDGNELAVSRQREDCLTLCHGRGWTEVVEYCDNNVSATNRRKVRSQYQQMLADISAGMIQAVVVWDLDRLYRQPRELEDFIDLADAHHLALATVTGDTDLSTDNGRLFARIKGAVAKAEGERKAARWKRSNEQGAAAGKWTASYRPFGYTWDGEPLEPEATAVREAYRDVLAGKTLRRIALDWNAAGFTTPTRYKNGQVTHAGKPWTNIQVRRLLLNPRYAALRVLRGMVVGRGVWTPLVDEDTWRGLCAMLRDPARARCTTFEVAHMGAGVYLCGRCGSPLITAYDKHGARLYRCKVSPHLSRRADKLDDYVTAYVLERCARDDAAVLTAEPEGVNSEDLHTAREALVARKDELSALFTDGVLDATAVRRDAAKLTARIAEIDRQLADAVRTSPAAALLDATGEQLWRRWEQMTPALRGQAVDELATVTVLPSPRGLRRFDPDYVEITWKQG